MQKSRLELLQEYKKQKILKQKNLNSLPNKTLKNVQNIRTKSSFTTSDPPSTSISDTSCDTIKSDNNTSIKSDTSKGFISKTLKSDTSMGFISKSSDKKNTSKSISNSSAAQEITIPELEEPPLDTTTNTVDSNYNPSNLDDLNTVERVSLPTDLILLNIELDSLKQQLQSILSENQDLKSQLQQYSSTKDEYRVEIIKELILLVESARVNGKGWDQLVLELDSLKFSSVNSEQVDIVVESAKQVQQQKEQELKQELKDAYQVIDHYELEIKEYEIMALVKENELNELEQALKQSLLDNQILEEKVKDLETKLEDKEFMDELKQIDAKNSSAVQDEKSQKQV